MTNQPAIDRREFIKSTAAIAGAVAVSQVAGTAVSANEIAAAAPDSLCHGPGWETLNPGFWQIKDGLLRRRVRNYGDRARATGFPFHYETHQQKAMPVEYDPSLPPGVIYRKEWKLLGRVVGFRILYVSRRG